MSERPRMFRQGDVLLREVSTIPDRATPAERDAGRIVLAYGEVTGHAHAIDAPPDEAVLLTSADQARFLSLVVDADLVHEEHDTITLPAGRYAVVLQREWTDDDDDRHERARWRFD